MRMRKKKNLLPRMERCADYLIPDPYAMPGKWRSLMPQARELRVELGCGKGRFTAGTAAAEPDVLLLAIELVPDAMVVAMERCRNLGLHNVFFLSANADQLPLFFAPGEVDRIYINFCDPWPNKGHARRRLTHGSFLKRYRQVLSPGGQIHFKTDNQPLFEFSVEEFPRYGFALSQVTRNLHKNGPVGVMTDYEAKFHALGQPINRLVATMQEPWEEPFPEEIREVRDRWLAAFGSHVSEEDLGKRVFSAGNYLWHLFSWELTPHESGQAALTALEAADFETAYLFYYEHPPASERRIRPVPREEALALACRSREDSSVPDGMDWYLTDKDFTWTLIHHHAEACGPYFARTQG